MPGAGGNLRCRDYRAAERRRRETMHFRLTWALRLPSLCNDKEAAVSKARTVLLSLNGRRVLLYDKLLDRHSGCGSEEVVYVVLSF